ncbi:MAG TPA: tetratricopeptide repeat protein [Candidatus Cybelea sp.]|nr:tetratricopeptide repeat protein [Candidatus Cybelea sp.]
MPLSEDETLVTSDSSVLVPGTDFGPRYRIESLLGEGGMGRVYKAYDRDLERMVAIKVVRAGALSETDALKRFKQELLLASKISHKNILRIHDMGEVAGVRFISMAYVDGRDLHQIIAHDPKMPTEQALNYARQLAEALAAAHAEGVIHRDLKPQNILVGKDGHVYVSDFGLAKSFDDGAIGMTRTGAFLGTPRYMSPEQAEGKPADCRSDIYAYGLILYEMLAGHVPFKGDTTLKVMYQRIHEKPKALKLANPAIPAWLDRVVMRCLERDPGARYQSADEILADLQASRSASAGSRTVQIAIPDFAGRRWAWISAAALTVALLALAIPGVRHRIVSAGRAEPAATLAGVPPLAQGKFVAVLPFRVLSDGVDLSYIAEGLNESLSAKLFQLRDLRLASESAVAKVKPSTPLAKVARSLGVNLIVEGMVEGNKDQMRIIVNLEDVAEGKRLWSQEFSGVPKDLLSLEDQISGQLVAALDVKPSNEEMARASARPTDNIDAYDLYLRGRQAYRDPDRQKAFKTAIDFYQQAIQKDPGFALAYTGIADASLGSYLMTKDSFWAQKALGAAQRAEQLKDSLAEVHFSLGSIYQATGKTAESIAELRRGLEIAPNTAGGYVRLGDIYLADGQTAEAVASYKKAISINPYNATYHWQLGRAYFSIGQNDKALTEFQRVAELEPDSADAWNNLATIYERMGRYEDSIPAYRKSIALGPNDWSSYANLGYVYTTLKQYDAAVQTLERAVELGPNQEMAFGNLADAYRYSGQREKAAETYDKAIALAFKELETNPQDAEVLGDLASYEAKKGDADRAAEFIARARAIDRQDVELMHIQAIVENLANKPADAVRSLHEALEKGYPVTEVSEDPELRNLKGRPDFESLINQYSRSDHRS